MNISELNKNVARFLSANVTGWVPVRAYQSESKPTGKLISYYIENILPVGVDQYISANDIDSGVTYQGIREIPVSLTFTGAGAMQAASDFLDTLRREEIDEQLAEYGLTHVFGENPVLLPELRGTEWVERCEMQWRLRTNSEFGGDAGRIETGVIAGNAGENDFTIDYSI